MDDTVDQRAGFLVRRCAQAWEIPMDVSAAEALGRHILNVMEWKPGDPNYPRRKPGASSAAPSQLPVLPLNPEDLDMIVVLVLVYSESDLTLDALGSIVDRTVAEHAAHERAMWLART